MRLPGARRRDLQPRERRRLRRARPRIDQRAAARRPPACRRSRLRRTSARRRASAGRRRGDRRSPRSSAAGRPRTPPASTLPRISPRYANSSSRVFGKPPTSSSGSGSPSEAHELVVRGALQRDDLQVLVVGDGAAQELHLEARLAFEVEDLLARVADVRSSDSRTLFCVTTSPSCGATRNLNSRGPDSAAVARTRTAAGLPSAGSCTFCDPTMRPSSSTSTVTVRPA